MSVVISSLILLLLTALSASLVSVVRVPLPLLQIAVGVIAELAGLRVGFDPDTFMLLFIPPLLFSDAYLIPKRDFIELRRVILTLAIGLVLFTTLACGFAIHALLPRLPLGACFALAAILSPTDAVAVSGILGSRAAPRRFMHILGGEALLNDASGLVCFKFAVVAAMTGVFSPARAAGAFVVIAIGGLAIGAIIALGFAWLHLFLLRRRSAEPAVQNTLLALLPFTAYLTAEHVHASGILAAVGAGLTISQKRIFSETDRSTRLRASALWEMIGFVFNGMVFLLLGLQLPGLVVAGVALAHAANRSPWLLPVIILAITGTLILLRFVWVMIVLAVRAVYARARHRRLVLPGLRGVAAMAAAGVRGAVTLAGILSLPVATGLTPGFPGRQLLIVLAAGVIVASLVIASLALPKLLANGAEPEHDPVSEEAERARAELARAALRDLDGARPGEAEAAESGGIRTEAHAAVLAEASRALARFDGAEEEAERLLRIDRQEASLRLHALRARRARLAELIRGREVSDEVERLLTQELDFEEEVLATAARTLPRVVHQPGPAGPGQPA